MKRKKVWRYYCEFCKKSSCSAASISRHEKRCTMNPNRYCGMCATVNLPQKPMTELIGILSGIAVVEKTNGDWKDLALEGDIDKSLQTLRDETENCPACVLAALRQKGILIPLTTFRFGDEVKRFWADFNDTQWEASDYSDCM